MKQGAMSPFIKKKLQLQLQEPRGDKEETVNSTPNALKPPKKYLCSLLSKNNIRGIVTNFTKSSAISIRCEGLNLIDILSPLNIAVRDFPRKYMECPSLPSPIA